MKIKRLLVLSLLPLLAGCSGGNASSSSIEKKEATIVDGQGRSVTYDKNKISRVICIGAGALRYYSYIGDVSKIIGVEEIDSGTTFGVGEALRPYYTANYNTFKTLPLIGKGGPAAQFADTEKITAANPDIVVSFLSADANDKLQSTINVPVIGLKQGGDGLFDEATLNSFKILGDVFNRTSRANELIDYVENSKKDLEKLELTTETYYAGGIGNWGQTSMYGSFQGWPVFKYAKVKSAIEDIEIVDSKGEVIKKGQVTIDMEKLQSINPDHIIMDTAGYNGFVADYKKEGNKVKYDALKAFKNNEVYQAMPYNAYFTNLEVQLMSTYYVASIAHEGFDVDIEKKSNEISEKFLGKQMYNDIKAHQYGMGGYQKMDLSKLGE